MSETNRHPAGNPTLLLGALALAGVAPVWASANVYLNTDGLCDGEAPCYTIISQALNAVSNGGTVHFQTEIPGALVSTSGKTNLTLLGQGPSTGIAGQILLNEVVTGWSIRDLATGGAITVQDVLTSLEIDNVEATNIKIGDLTVDTDASLTVKNSIITNTTGAIGVFGSNGVSLEGTIEFANNAGVGLDGVSAIVVQLNVAASQATTLDADIQITGNRIRAGGGVSLRGSPFGGGSSEAGLGTLAGSIRIADNTGYYPSSYTKVGVGNFGAVTGDITADIEFSDNDLDWMAILTTSADGAITGPLDFTGNHTEAIEIVSAGGPIGPGHTHIIDNSVLELGGIPAGELDRPLILMIGDEGVSGETVITDNEAPDAKLVVRADDNGEITSPVEIARNSAGLLTLEARGGSISEAFSVVGNSVTADPGGDGGTLTIRTMVSGDSNGGLVQSNSSDDLTINIDGSISSSLNIMENVARGLMTLRRSGPSTVSGLVEGNNIADLAFLSGWDSTVQYNRIASDLSTTASQVDAFRNWWLCDQGPGAAACSSNLPTGNPAPADPWLTLS